MRMVFPQGSSVKNGGGTLSEGGALARTNGRIEVEALSGRDRRVAARRLRVRQVGQDGKETEP